MFANVIKIKYKFPCILVGREGFEPSYSNENRFLTTIVFTTIINIMFVVWTFSLSSMKISGVKSLHSEIYFLARDCHQLTC